MARGSCGAKLMAKCEFKIKELVLCHPQSFVKCNTAALKVWSLPLGLVTIFLRSLLNVSQESFLTGHQFLCAVPALYVAIIDVNNRVSFLFYPSIHDGFYIQIFAYLGKEKSIPVSLRTLEPVVQKSVFQSK